MTTNREQGGSDPTSAGPQDDHVLRLRGKPLATRSRFYFKRVLAVLLYLAVLATSIVGIFALESVLFKGIGFTLLVVAAYIAFEVFAEGIFYLRRALDYGEYRRKWELANGDESNAV